MMPRGEKQISSVFDNMKLKAKKLLAFSDTNSPSVSNSSQSDPSKEPRRLRRRSKSTGNLEQEVEATPNPRNLPENIRTAEDESTVNPVEKRKKRRKPDDLMLEEARKFLKEGQVPSNSPQIQTFKRSRARSRSRSRSPSRPRN
jgi:hypothetical protein